MLEQNTIREAWLMEAASLLRLRHFKPVGYDVPDAIRVSVGFPRSKRSKGQHAIGQCWSAENSADRKNEIFISPELAEPSRVLDVLIHELVHATVGIPAGHKKAFKDCAVKVGLGGKMTATVATPELEERLHGYLKELPPYPHAALNTRSLSSGPKKQTTRMLKLLCPDCGYAARTTRQWIEVGLPVCPCGTEMELGESHGDE